MDLAFIDIIHTPRHWSILSCVVHILTPISSVNHVSKWIDTRVLNEEDSFAPTVSIRSASFDFQISLFERDRPNENLEAV
jgi:hypothetical protein